MPMVWRSTSLGKVSPLSRWREKMPKRLWLPSIFALLFSLAHAAASERAHLFSGRSCGGCERIEKALNAAAIPYRYYNIDEIENYKILVGYEEALGITAQELPALVAGGRLFAGTENILRAIAEIRQALAGGTGVSLEVAASSGEEIERRFRSIDILSLCLAGLGDGINPCAFATIAFLVGCLAAAGRRKALYVGLSFTAGVFITYFAVGLGFFRALFMLREFMALREYFHYGALGLLLMGAVLLFWTRSGSASVTASRCFICPRRCADGRTCRWRGGCTGGAGFSAAF